MKYYDHLSMEYRALQGHAVVDAIDDTGSQQTIGLTGFYGMPRSQVPVYQQFGFSSRVPVNGAVTVFFALNGDHSEIMALPPCNPTLAHFGDLGDGDSVLYDAAGQRLQFHNGTLVDLQATSDIRITIGETVVLELTETQATLNVPLVANKGITSNDDVKVNGAIASTGDMVANGISATGHEHSGVQKGDVQSGPPVAG